MTRLTAFLPPSLLAALLALPLAPRAAAQPYGPPAPPPPPPAYVAPPPPPPGAFVWEPGHYRWTRAGYVWIPGHYVARRPHLARFVPGHWSPRGGWHWVPEHWAP